MILAKWKMADERWLLSPKLIYFSLGGLFYTFHVYRMQFYIDFLGFAEDKAGIISAISNVASFLGVTGWSRLADTLQRHRLILVSLGLAMTLVFESLYLVRLFLPQWLWFPISLLPFTLYGLASGGLMPLADYQILKLLSERFAVSQDLYGRQVMFGTVAYGLVSYLMGFLIKQFSVTALFLVMPLMGLFFTLFLMLMGVADEPRRIELQDEKASLKTERTEKSFSIVTYVKIIAQPRFLYFLLIILSIGVGRQVLSLFIPHYMRNTLLLNSDEIGTIYMVSSFSSLPFLFLAPHLLKRFGTAMMLVIGTVALAFRLGSYGWLLQPGPTCPYRVTLIEALNGISFSFVHMAGVREAGKCAPTGWEATFQAVYSSAYTQFPAIFVSLGGGWLYKIYGGRFMMQLATYMTVLSLGLLLLKFLSDRCCIVPRKGPSTVKP